MPPIEIAKIKIPQAPLLADTINALIDAYNRLSGRQFSAGRNMRYTEDEDNVMFESDGEGGDGVDSATPFFVFSRVDPSNPSAYQAAVESFSFVMADVNPQSNVEIKVGEDKLYDLAIVQQSQVLRWFTLLPTDIVWLQYTVSTGKYEIKSIGRGDAWADPTKHITLGPDGTTPVDYRIMLAASQQPGGSAPLLAQKVYTHLIRKQLCYETWSAFSFDVCAFAPYIPEPAP